MVWGFVDTAFFSEMHLIHCAATGAASASYGGTHEPHEQIAVGLVASKATSGLSTPPKLEICIFYASNAENQNLST